MPGRIDEAAGGEKKTAGTWSWRRYAVLRHHFVGGISLTGDEKTGITPLLGWLGARFV